MIDKYPISNGKYSISKISFFEIGNWKLEIGNSRRWRAGQALVTLLFFTVIGLSVVTGSVMVVMANAMSGTRFQQGSIAYEIAQSGMENALLRLLRDPSYTGETLSVGSGSASIAVVSNGADMYTVTSVGTLGNFTKRIQASVTYNNNEFEVTERREIQ